MRNSKLSDQEAEATEVARRPKGRPQFESLC